VNISGNFKLNKNLEFFFTGKNIGDEKYIGSRLHSNPGQKDANISSGILPGPRRQVNFGINYNF
jgi:Fe(3+) dicitrate transport protein